MSALAGENQQSQETSSTSSEGSWQLHQVVTLLVFQHLNTASIRLQTQKSLGHIRSHLSPIQWECY